MDAGSDLGSAAKGLAIGLEVAGFGPVSCRFSIPFSFLPCVFSSLLLIQYKCTWTRAIMLQCHCLEGT